MIKSFSMRLLRKTLKMHLLNNKEFLNALARKDVEDAFIK